MHADDRHTMKIGYIVDHPKRDLDGAIRVAHAFVKRGVETFLIPLYDQGTDVPLLGLDALIVNYARPINLPLVQGYVAMGIPVFVLDTEGGILSETGANSADGLSTYIHNSEYRELLSGYLFWGSLLRDAFAAADALPTSRLHVTGCPRFDFASPRWDDTLEFPRDGYVLVNANFPLVNPAFARDGDAESTVLVNSGWDPDYVARMLADQRQILRGYLNAIHGAASALPEQAFLVRPHPFENADIYRDKFSDLDNVSVNGRGNVLNVIRHSACVLHLNCGTSIEAVMLRRPPISMEFLNTPHMAGHSTLPSRISETAMSMKQLHAMLADLDATRARFDFDATYREFIRPYFHENDGAAGDRVADAVIKTITANSDHQARRQILWSLRSSRHRSRIGQKIQSALANLLGSAASARLRALHQPKRREKFLDLIATRDVIGKLARHEDTPVAHVSPARHPLSGLPLASLRVRP